MNKKPKILTLVALAVFGVIIMLHYVPVYQHSYNSYLVEKHEQNSSKQIREYFLVRGSFRLPPLIHDVRMPLFVLAVFYAGLFAILGDSKLS